ncbi:MAG: sodium-coupled permease [Opitutaceae bacterium]|nr:sodium-coupled permease [Opitutaceae bacterium]|tara:strand:+ start:188 stop:1825 length:1638 start_codon:yes stop_codon:yes gene_type:complete
MLSKVFFKLSTLKVLCIPIGVFLFPYSGIGAEGDSVATTERGNGLLAIDWIIVVAYATSTIVFGWWFGRKQKTTQEYFVGSGNMNPMLIGVSLFATLLSTISYMSMPGEALGKGPADLSKIISYPFVFLIVGFVLLPVYMRQKVTSAYELLEAKLGLSIRLLGASMFLILRLFWMSLLVYLTALAITIMIGVSEDYIPWVVVITGAVAITYTSLGGLRAVVITDLMQTLLLYGGALLVIGTITVRMGGFGWFPTEWQSDIWDSQPLFSLDPSTRVTVFGSILSVFVFYCAVAGGDQVSIQRFMATKDARTARKAVAMQISVGVVVAVTLVITGFALLGYFQANPELLPTGLSIKVDADKVFPHFIAYELPPVVSGLVVAGLFAAAMSSIDSGVNSITAVVMTDFLDRFGLKPATVSKQVWFARGLAVGIGIIIVLSSAIMEHVPGNISAVTQKTVNLLTVPIFILFFFALFIPFANPVGVWIGVLCSIATASLISFSGPIFGMNEQGYDPISFQWIAPSALVVGISVGSAACWLFSSRRRVEFSP